MMKHSNEERNVQTNMLFNTVGSLIYYACQWLMSVLVVRISGYEDAGILAIAMSVTASPAIVGLFNIRSYQVSDVKGEFTNKTYIYSRIYTNVASFIVCAAMVGIGGYTYEKAMVILTFMVFKVVEGFADVYYGIEQMNARMDYAGISLAVRGVGTIGFFIMGFIFLKSLLASILLLTVFNILFLLFYDRRIIKKWIKTDDVFDNKEIVRLLCICFPLAVVAFLNNLSINIPKIFLEDYFGSEIMGFYSSVASPTVVIQLAATTVFAPLVPILTKEYNENNYKNFMAIIKKFVLLVVVLSCICVLCAKVLGRWVLVLLFGDKIEPYVYLFIPIIFMSIMIAINACLFSVCTLLRIIKAQYIIGIVGIVVSWILSIVLVKQFSMMGVVYSLVISLLIQIVIQLMLITGKVLKIKR